MSITDWIKNLLRSYRKRKSDKNRFELKDYFTHDKSGLKFKCIRITRSNPACGPSCIKAEIELDYSTWTE